MERIWTVKNKYRSNTIVTLEEASRILGYSPRTLRAWRATTPIERFWGSDGKTAYYRLKDMERLAWNKTHTDVFKTYLVKRAQKGQGATSLKKLPKVPDLKE